MTRTKARVGIIIAMIVVVIGLLVGVVFFFTSTWTKSDGGTVTVVRNGGLFDDNTVRDVVQPNSSVTYEGLASQEHPYPASQRYFKVSSSGDADSNEQITVQTKDSVNVNVEGTFYFQLTTDPVILEDFDNKFGTRTFPSGDDQVHAWDEDGWGPFLNATVGNVVQNVLRQQIGQVKCQDLQASCALVFNANAQIDPNNTEGGNTALSTIQDNVNTSFMSDVKQYLGGDYFTNVQFVLAKVTLPQATQDAIDASFAKVATQAGETQASQGKLNQAQIDAQTNAQKQQGYLACPSCAVIDQLKALPPGITTYAPGGAFAVGAQPAPAPQG